jgi:hypothetical protein
MGSIDGTRRARFELLVRDLLDHVKSRCQCRRDSDAEHCQDVVVEIRSELRPLADENGQLAGYVFVDSPLTRGAVSVIFRQGADGRTGDGVDGPGRGPRGEGGVTYVFTHLEPMAAATPAP